MNPFPSRGPGALIYLALAVTVLAHSKSTAVESAPATDSAPPSAESVLAAAFANRYEVDLISSIELVMRNQSGQERRRLFHAVSKVIDDRIHSVGRLVWPPRLRGMTVLTIENHDRSHDAFVYLPSLGRVRRVTTAQRGDSFFGSDVTYEDLERRRIAEYELDGLDSRALLGEAVYVIRGRSLRNFSYSHVLFVVSKTDGAILETRYFKRGDDQPFRVISAPREGMVERDGHVFPTRLTVHNRVRGTSTEVVFTNLEINPPIDDRVFSVMTLEMERRIPERGRQRRAAPLQE